MAGNASSWTLVGPYAAIESTSPRLRAPRPKLTTRRVTATVGVAVHPLEFHTNCGPIRFDCWDTAGQDEYKQFRPLSYDQADGFIVAFSLVDRESFEHVASRWIKEVRLEEKGRSKSKSKPRAPVILVGTKLDLRVKGGRPGADVVTTEMGEKMARKCGAAAYVECSALTQDNLKKVFDVSVAAAAESMFPADETGATRESAGGGCCAVS